MLAWNAPSGPLHGRQRVRVGGEDPENLSALAGGTRSGPRRRMRKQREMAIWHLVLESALAQRGDDREAIPFPSGADEAG